MAFLIPDSTYSFSVGGDTLTVKVKITPDGAVAEKNIASHIRKGQVVKPNKLLNDGSGIPRGITIHNTDMIKPQTGTTAAEQYARATYPNGNMGGVCVHYWVCGREIWQQLSDNERGWHAGDGHKRWASQRAGAQIGGNMDTIAIECIETGEDAATEDTTAKLAAYLLHKHGLDPAYDIYAHKYFSGKQCPIYILPRWTQYKATITKHYAKLAGLEDAEAFAVGDMVRCNDGVTTYSNGGRMASWVPSVTLYVRRIEQGGEVLLVSTEPVKAVYTGRVFASDVYKV